MRLLAPLALLALAACSKAPTAEQCDRLVAHVIELELAEATLEGESKESLAQKLEAEIGESTRAFCNEEVPRAKVECGLAAKTSAEFATCDVIKP